MVFTFFDGLAWRRDGRNHVSFSDLVILAGFLADGTTTLQNARMWEPISVPATECPRISARFLEEERTMMGERWFRQEYLCEFVDVNDSLFDREMLESAIDDSVAPLVFPSRRL